MQQEQNPKYTRSPEGDEHLRIFGRDLDYQQALTNWSAYRVVDYALEKSLVQIVLDGDPFSYNGNTYEIDLRKLPPTLRSIGDAERLAVCCVLISMQHSIATLHAKVTGGPLTNEKTVDWIYRDLAQDLLEVAQRTFEIEANNFSNAINRDLLTFVLAAFPANKIGLSYPTLLSRAETLHEFQSNVLHLDHALELDLSDRCYSLGSRSEAFPSPAPAPLPSHRTVLPLLSEGEIAEVLARTFPGTPKPECTFIWRDRPMLYRDDMAMLDLDYLRDLQCFGEKRGDDRGAKRHTLTQSYLKHLLSAEWDTFLQSKTSEQLRTEQELVGFPVSAFGERDTLVIIAGRADFLKKMDREYYGQKNLQVRAQRVLGIVRDSYEACQELNLTFPFVTWENYHTPLEHQASLSSRLIGLVSPLVGVEPALLRAVRKCILPEASIEVEIQAQKHFSSLHSEGYSHDSKLLPSLYELFASETSENKLKLVTLLKTWRSHLAFGHPAFGHPIVYDEEVLRIYSLFPDESLRLWALAHAESFASALEKMSELGSDDDKNEEYAAYFARLLNRNPQMFTEQFPELSPLFIRLREIVNIYWPE